MLQKGKAYWWSGDICQILIPPRVVSIKEEREESQQSLWGEWGTVCFPHCLGPIGTFAPGEAANPSHIRRFAWYRIGRNHIPTDTQTESAHTKIHFWIQG